MSFLPVATIADLETLDQDEVLAGYMEYRADDPEPGPNRGRAYWHGWRNRAIDKRDPRVPYPNEATTALAREIVATGYLQKLCR